MRKPELPEVMFWMLCDAKPVPPDLSVDNDILVCAGSSVHPPRSLTHKMFVEPMVTPISSFSQSVNQSCSDTIVSVLTPRSTTADALIWFQVFKVIGDLSVPEQHVDDTIRYLRWIHARVAFADRGDAGICVGKSLWGI